MHAKCEGTNKSPKILSVVENKLETVICWQMEKTSQSKNLTGWFKGHHSQESTNQQSSSYEYKESY